MAKEIIRKILTICDLTAKFNVLLGINYNLLLSINRDDLRSAIGIARMVD